MPPAPWPEPTPPAGCRGTLLGGIGRVESDHGRYGGSTLASNGVSHPLIIGVPLNGEGPVAAIRDTDDGAFDGDRVWDRAVGPMQFIPSTWAGAARDGDGDGVSSPNDIDDAATAAAAYLCSGTGSVLGEAGMAAAIYRYNQDDSYVALVMAFERGYRTGSFVMPTPPPPAEETEAGPRHHEDKHPSGPAAHRPAGAGKPASTTAPKPTQPPSPSPSHQPTSEPKPPPHPTHPAQPKPTHQPASKPDAKPHPKPTQHGPRPTHGHGSKPAPKPTHPHAPKPDTQPTVLTRVVGAFKQCGRPSGWCLDGTRLDLGPVVPDGPAAADYDHDRSTVTNAAQFHGLALAPSVTLQVTTGATGVAVVYTINGLGYRNADGTLARAASTRVRADGIRGWRPHARRASPEGWTRTGPHES